MSSRVLAWTTWLNGGPLPVILDEAVGEELRRRGPQGEETPFASASLWASSLLVTPEGRAQISQLAREYLDAGADILTTATYQATPALFETEFPDNNSECPFQASVALLDGVRKKFWSEAKTTNTSRRYPAIAGSIGPLASWMKDECEFEGRYEGVTFQDFFASHKASALKFVRLEGTGPDVLAFETIPSGLEAEAIASAMSNTWELSSVPYWISLQCRDHGKLANGDTVMQVVQDVLRISRRNNLVGIGVNCMDIKYAAALASNIDRAFKCFRKFNVEDHKNISILVYPNNALPKVSSKVNIVGACCGVGPEGLKEWISKKPS